jgi:hypothetical protein
MYHEYKYQIDESSSFHIKQMNASSFKTLDDVLNDDATVQTFSNENEFTSYQRQDILRTNLYINSTNEFCF